MGKEYAAVLKYINELKQAGPFNNQEELASLENSLKSFNALISYLPSALYVLDFSSGQYLYFSESAKKMCGYSASEILNNGISWVVQRVHPEDTMVYSAEVFHRFLHYCKLIKDEELPFVRFSYNWRFKKRNGKYIQVLQQYFILKRDLNKQPILSLGLITDITSVKAEEGMQFTVAKLNDRDGNEEVLYSNKFSTHAYKLSPREIQIIQLICQGETSKTIGAKLNISQYTVRAHRRKIFEKMEVRNMAELCRKALDQGLIPPNDAISS